MAHQEDNSDSDFESVDNGPSKPGRKKNPNSQAARRDQNRIAQREFRLRKQQRIRDLEARVEILSGGQDEALGEMRNILKDLMEENHTLRGLIKNLAGFIGEGTGGILPKLGWDASDFDNYINRSETDTAWEGYQRRKKAKQAAADTSTTSHKRPSTDDSGAARSKKPRGDDGVDTQYSMLLPMQPPQPLSAPYSSTRTQDTVGMFSDLMRNGSSPGLFAQPPPQPSTSGFTGTSQQSNINGSFPSPYPPSSLSLSSESPIPSIPFTSTTTSSPVQRPASQAAVDQAEEDDDPNKNEAYKLIHYHLDNYKRNSAYCLPSSLRPTLVQKTVPHEGVIDRILHPELRDRMILLRGRFDLVDCLLEYRNSVTIHGDDVLAHSNWEIGEKWLRKYGFLIDPTTLGIMNRWRKERGEPELRLSDINSAEHTPGPTT